MQIGKKKTPKADRGKSLEERVAALEKAVEKLEGKAAGGEGGR